MPREPDTYWRCEPAHARAKDPLQAELTAKPAAADGTALHLAVLARYEEQLERLEAALANSVASGDDEASTGIRDLVESVTVRRTRHGYRAGVRVEIVGRLRALLGPEHYPNGVWGSVVAEEGNSKG